MTKKSRNPKKSRDFFFFLHSVQKIFLLHLLNDSLESLRVVDS